MAVNVLIYSWDYDLFPTFNSSVFFLFFLWLVLVFSEHLVIVGLLYFQNLQHKRYKNKNLKCFYYN